MSPTEPPSMAKNNCTSPYSQSQPFVRDRVDKNGYTSAVPSTVDRENRLLQQKIHAIRHRPSSSSGNRPCAAASRSTDGSVGGSQPWESFKVQSHIQPSAGKSLRRASDRKIQQDNLVLRRKLQERYGLRKDSFVVANQLGTGLDCNSRWQQRTSLYGCPPTGGSAEKLSSSARPSSAPAAAQLAGASQGLSLSARSTLATCNQSIKNTGVPKTLGVAACAGCGCRSFYQADGSRLKPCPHCKQVHYCSETCARIDQPSHKALCRYYVTGHWTPAGVRPAADCWVMNRSMAVARKLLKQRQQLQQTETQSYSRPATAAAVYSTNRTQKLSTSSEGSLLQVPAGPSGAAPDAGLEELQDASAASATSDALRRSMTDAVQLDLAGHQLSAQGVVGSGGSCSRAGAAAFEHLPSGEMVYRRTSSSMKFSPAGEYDLPLTPPAVKVSTLTVPPRAEAAGKPIMIEGRTKAEPPDKRLNAELSFEQELHQKLAAARLQELQEEAGQDLVELRASQGLDGPRPCLCVNGREQRYGVPTAKRVNLTQL